MSVQGIKIPENHEIKSVTFYKTIEKVLKLFIPPLFTKE